MTGRPPGGWPEPLSAGCPLRTPEPVHDAKSGPQQALPRQKLRMTKGVHTLWGLLPHQLLLEQEGKLGKTTFEKLFLDNVDYEEEGLLKFGFPRKHKTSVFPEKGEGAKERKTTLASFCSERISSLCNC